MISQRKLTQALLLLSAALLLQSCIAGNYMVRYALQPKHHGTDIERSKAYMAKAYDMGDWFEKMDREGLMRDTTMVAADGTTRHAYFAAAPGSKKTAVIVHGYTSNAIGMMMIGRMFLDSLGYNILLPDLHYHGLSEGDHIRMGWKDRLDVVEWSRIAHETFQDTLQVIHGISMGGATTMMVSGEELPEYVRGFIEDCGYTSVWDEFKGELKNQFHLPAWPVLYSANNICRRKYGWDFKEASAVKQLAKCTRPMMFIHGDADTFVPTWMVHVNYEAKTQGYKELWLAPDTKHALSFYNYPQEYVQRVRKFLAEHVE